MKNTNTKSPRLLLGIPSGRSIRDAALTAAGMFSRMNTETPLRFKVAAKSLIAEARLEEFKNSRSSNS